MDTYQINWVCLKYLYTDSSNTPDYWLQLPTEIFWVPELNFSIDMSIQNRYVRNNSSDPTNIPDYRVSEQASVSDYNTNVLLQHHLYIRPRN